MPARAKSILVIEDDDTLRESLANLLVLEGFRIVSAKTGSQGLALYLEDPVDLIITDLAMPEMNGLDMIALIQARNPEAKIIALSAGFGGTPADSLNEALRLGARLAFEKPFRPKKLLDGIKLVIGDQT